MTCEYHLYLPLSPELTIESLCKGSTLIELFDESVSDRILIYRVGTEVVEYRSRMYPFSSQKLSKVNNEMVLRRYQFEMCRGEGDWDEKGEFGQFIMCIKDPDTVLRGTGLNNLGAQTVNLFEMGAFLLPSEFHEIVENTSILLYSLCSFAQLISLGRLGNSFASY
jgi:hypothetical protein